MLAQDLDGTPDGGDLRGRQRRVVLGIELEYALEILERPWRERYFRQDFGRGRRARLPSARAVMYRSTSSAA